MSLLPKCLCPLFTGMKYSSDYVANALLVINIYKLPEIIKSYKINRGNYNKGNNNMSYTEGMWIWSTEQFTAEVEKTSSSLFLSSFPPSHSLLNLFFSSSCHENKRCYREGADKRKQGRGGERHWRVPPEVIPPSLSVHMLLLLGGGRAAERQADRLWLDGTCMSKQPRGVCVCFQSVFRVCVCVFSLLCVGVWFGSNVFSVHL